MTPSTTILLTAMTMAIAVALWIPPAARHRLDRILRTESSSDHTSPRAPRSAAVEAAAAVRRRLTRVGPAGRRYRAAERERVVEAIHALAAELSAGRSPHIALQRALTPTDPRTASVAPQTLAAVRYGGDIVDALHGDAVAQPVLRGVAVCWAVGMHSGAGLAAALVRLAAAARAAADAQAEIEAHLAGPRASAQMMALLPVMGLLLGTALGANPVGWLAGTWLGWVCLALGLLLTVTGVLWTGRIAHRAEQALP